MRSFVSKLQQRDKKIGWLLFGLVFILQILTMLTEIAA